MLRNFVLAFFLAASSLNFLNWKVLGSQQARFYCALRDDYPHTLVSTSENEYAIIRWRRLYNPNSAASLRRVSARCQNVAENFQNAYDSGNFHYVTSGRRNMRSLICASDRRGGDCIHTLIDLHQSEDARSVMMKLFDIRNLTPGELLDQNRRLYIDIQDIFPSSNSTNNLGQ